MFDTKLEVNLPNAKKLIDSVGSRNPLLASTFRDWVAANEEEAEPAERKDIPLLFEPCGKCRSASKEGQAWNWLKCSRLEFSRLGRVQDCWTAEIRAREAGSEIACWEATEESELPEEPQQGKDHEKPKGEKEKTSSIRPRIPKPE